MVLTLCATGVKLSPVVDIKIRGGWAAASSGIYSSAVTPPTRSVLLTTIIPRNAMSGEINLPGALGFGISLGDWNTRFQVLVSGVYCQISACRFRSYLSAGQVTPGADFVEYVPTP